MYCLKLMKDLTDILVMEYLRKVDKSDSLLTMLLMASPNSYLVVRNTQKQRKQTKSIKCLQDIHSKTCNRMSLFAQFLLIMLATLANTSPVEPGFSHLEMVATTSRNHVKPENIETLFLLATQKIPVKPADCYENEMKILEQ